MMVMSCAKKLLASLLAGCLLAALLPAFASAKTVSVATFDLRKMEFYNESLAHWFIRKDTTPEEYLCVMSASQLAPNKDYAACKTYSVQSDCDFWFEGFCQMTQPSWVKDEEAKGSTMDFFVCAKDGTVIYPTDGSPYRTLTLDEGSVDLSFGVSGLSKGDTIYFITRTKAAYYSPYMTMVGTLFETPQGKKRSEGYTDTNEFYDVQDKEGWGYCYIPSGSIKFQNKEVQVTTTVAPTTTTRAVTTVATPTTTTVQASSTQSAAPDSSAADASNLPAGGSGVSDPEGGGGGNWVLPVIIVAVVLVLAGGGAAAYFLVKKKKGSGGE